MIRIYPTAVLLALALTACAGPVRHLVQTPEELPTSNVVAEHSRFAWKPRHAPIEPAVFDGAMCYDAAREQFVAFGGSHRRYDADGKTHLFEGGHWREAECIWSPGARDGAAMVYDSKRKVCVLFGGQNYYSAPSDDTWEWNGHTWSPKETATKPPPRRGHVMAFDEERGVTVMYGGAKNDGSVWEYDGKDWKECECQSGPSQNRGSMCYDRTFRVCLFFGGAPGEKISDTWRWNGVDWLELECKEPPTHLGWFALAWCESLKQTVLVGETVKGEQRMCVYVGPRWHTLETNVPWYRKDGACLASGRAGLLLHGGNKRGCGRDDTWEFDGAWNSSNGLFQGGWRELTGQCTPRFDTEEVMFYDASRKLTYLIGTDWDETDGQDYRQHMWAWDGWNWRAVECRSFPPRGVRHVVHDEKRGVSVCVVRTGEYGNPSWSVWEWEGLYWRQSGVAGNLVDGLYFDPVWKEPFGLFWSESPKDSPVWSSKAEVRSWNGSRWETRASLELPALKDYARFAYDPTRRVTLILTGAESEKHFHATYEYDFAILRKLDTRNAPFIAAARSMIAFPPQGKVLLAGCGFDYEEQMTFDYFWTFDGAGWSMPRVLTKPTPRRSPLLAYDSHRQTVVAFGGQDTWGWIFDTWEYSPDI